MKKNVIAEYLNLLVTSGAIPWFAADLACVLGFNCHVSFIVNLHLITS